MSDNTSKTPLRDSEGDEVRLGVPDKRLNVVYLARKYQQLQAPATEIPMTREERLQAQIAAALGWAVAENVPADTRLQAIRSILGETAA